MTNLGKDVNDKILSMALSCTQNNLVCLHSSVVAMAASFMVGYMVASSPCIVRTVLGVTVEAAARAMLRVASAGLSGTVSLVRRVCNGRGEDADLDNDQPDEENRLNNERFSSSGECIVEVLSCNGVPVSPTSWCPRMISGGRPLESLAGVWYGRSLVDGADLRHPVETAAIVQIQGDYLPSFGDEELTWNRLFFQGLDPQSSVNSLAPGRSDMLREIREGTGGRCSRLSMATSSSSIDSLEPYENTGDFPMSPQDPMLQSLPGIPPSPPPSVCTPNAGLQASDVSDDSEGEADEELESVWSVVSTDQSEALLSSSPSNSDAPDASFPNLDEKLLHLPDTESESDE